MASWQDKVLEAVLKGLNAGDENQPSRKAVDEESMKENLAKIISHKREIAACDEKIRELRRETNEMERNIRNSQNIKRSNFRVRYSRNELRAMMEWVIDRDFSEWRKISTWKRFNYSQVGRQFPARPASARRQRFVNIMEREEDYLVFRLRKR